MGDERLRNLYRYWRLVRGRRFAPGRADIDPNDIRPLLPVLALIDVVAGDRFRFRLAGDDVTAQFGRGLIGKRVEEVLRDDSYERLITLFDLVRTSRRPAFWDGPEIAARPGSRLSRFAAPVSGDGQQVTMLLAGQITYFGPSGPELFIIEKPGGLSETVASKSSVDAP